MTDDSRRDPPLRTDTAVTDRVRAALGSRYRIEREIGAGGMATVFLATVDFLSHDALRAIVSSQSFTTNVAVLRAPARQR